MRVTNTTMLHDAVTKLQKEYDSEVFRDLYDALAPKLYALCLRYMKDENKAKDVLQESFVIIYEKIKSFKGDGSFEGWAKRITVRQCIYNLKKNVLSVDILEKDLPYTEQKEFDLERHETEIKNKLNNALKQLSDGYRTIINLYVLEGYSHSEIAAMLNINEGTSRSQLNRAKAALRKLISARK